MKQRIGILGVIIGLVTLLAACGGEDSPTTQPTATAVQPPATAPAEPKPTPTSEAMMMEKDAPGDEVLLIMLNEQNASGQTGWAELTAKGDQTEVVLNLSPGSLESELVHIHTGSCGEDTLGGVAHGLTSFAGGSGASKTTVDASLGSLRTGDFAINTHQMGNPGTYTSCGNLPIEADALTISLNEMTASGQSGWATLTARGSKTEVVLSLSPGTMQTELVHIHTGSCGEDNLGGDAYGLTSFAGGSGGSKTTVDASLSSLRTGDFAINTHQMGAPGTYTSCGNIPAEAA